MTRNSIGMPAVRTSTHTWPQSRRSAIVANSGLGAVACAMQRGATALASAALAVALVGFTAGPAAADDPRQNEPGKFDFYVLALSWSPSYCDSIGERAQQQPEC